MNNRRSLQCGVVAGPLFVATFLVEGAVRPDYDALRHPVSSLALGPWGWVQVANFVVTGTLYLAFAIGLSRTPKTLVRTRVGPILVGASAVGLIGAGVFATDPLSGYPLGTPDVLTDRTTAGLLHDLFSAPTFLGLPTAAVLFALSSRRDDRRWACYSAGSALVLLVAFGLASAALGQVPTLVDHGGLFQRVSVIAGFTWLTALAVRCLRVLDRPSHGEPAAVTRPE